MELKHARVGIAGLGGLGSNIAVMLARAGVGTLVTADFDRVEQSNLNRQYYLPAHIGCLKAEALAEQLTAIRPEIHLQTHVARVTAKNAASLFSGCDVICEAFDRAEAKAELISAVLSQQPEAYVVSASGMGGTASANRIVTRQVMKRLYLCGDGASGTEQGMFAPRVMVCAAHEANMVLRLLLGEREA